MNEQDELMKVLQSIVSDVTQEPLPEVTPDTPLAELGIDSVLAAEIVTRIEDKLEIEVPVSQWIRARTFQDFVDAIMMAREKPI
jgi:acyl carrier protein